MKKKLLMCGMFTLLMIFFFSLSQPAAMELDWTVRKQLDLKGPAVDISASIDGQWIFILTPGEVLVYSISEEKVLNRIPVDKAFDRVMHSARTNTLLLASSSENTMKIIQLEPIHDFDISGLPFRGPENAPITIAVFGDYQ